MGEDSPQHCHVDEYEADDACRCNQNSKDVKQGGIWEVPCLAFMINPNPDGYKGC